MEHTEIVSPDQTKRMAYLEISASLPLNGIHIGATNWSGYSEPTASEPCVRYGASVTTAFPSQCIRTAPSHRFNPLQSTETVVTCSSWAGQPINSEQVVTVDDGNPRIDS